MPIDPSISMGVRPLEVPNPLNQLAQVSQIQAAQQQQQIGQMQLEDLLNDRKEMLALQRDTGTTTPQLISSLLRSPKTRAQGVELQMKYQQQLQADKFLRQRYPDMPGLFGEEKTATPAASATAPMAAQIEPTGAQVGGPIAAPNVMAAPLTAPRNAMVTPAAAPAAAPANALTAPPTQGAASPTGRTRQELEYTIELAKTNPYLAGAGEVAKLELAEMLKTPPDLATMRALNIPATEAGFTKFQRLKENPGEFARTLDRLDLPPAQRRAIEMQYAQKLATHAPAPTMVNVQEKAEAGAYGKMLIDQYGKLVESAELAAKTLPSIEANLSALNKGLDTGFGTEAKAAAAKVLAALGVQSAEKYATDTQTFQSNAIQGLLQKQLEQKGPQTESDAQRIEQAGAQLGKTKAANEFILTVAKEQLQRDREQRDFYRSWKKKTGSFDGADDAWAASQGNKSLFDRPALKKYAVGAVPTETNKRTLGLDAIFNPQPQAR